MTGRKRNTPGDSAAGLLIAAGLFTLVNNYLPGSQHLDVAALNAVAFGAMAVGVGSLLAPWPRLHPRMPLLLVLVAFALIASGNLLGGVSDFSYAVYFVVVFVWVGIAQPVGTSFWLAPLAVLAYVAPLLARDDPPTNAVSSVTVAIPVCVLVGEVLARQVRRLEQSREALRDQVAQLEGRRAREQAVVDALNDGLLVLDPAGRVSAANASAVALLGSPAAELVGSAPPLAVGPPGTTVEHLAPGGRRLEATSSALPGTRELVVALHDVSRQRALDEAKDLFLAATSHELRTPLTAVKGYVRTLQRRWHDLPDERRLAALATISARTDDLVSLTDHLLLGARAGVTRSAAEAFDLTQTLTEAVAQYRHVSTRHPLVLDLPCDLPPVVGDRGAVVQVLGQLVENAVKYSPQGGEVTIRAHADAAFVVVEVSDRGVGIPPGTESEIFTPFFQAGATNTREYGGVGLGLHIVRQLVQAQGGEVDARNGEHGGAVLCFSLPRAAVPRTAPGPTPVAPRASSESGDGRESNPPATDAAAHRC